MVIRRERLSYQLLKMKAEIYIFLILSSFFILSCQEVDKRKKFYNDDGLLVKRAFYPDSYIIKLERTYKHDTIPHGYGKSFYPSGQLELYIDYIDGKKEGREIEFFENGLKRKEGWCKNDKQDSIWIWYDSLGRVEQEDQWNYGVLVGEQKHFFSNGKIEVCNYYTPLGDLAFKQTNDSTGIIVQEEGMKKPFIVVRAAHSIHEFKVGETYLAKVYFCLCGGNNYGILELFDITNNILLESHSLTPNQSNFVYTKKLLAAGEYRFSIKHSDDGDPITSTDFVVK